MNFRALPLLLSRVTLLLLALVAFSQSTRAEDLAFTPLFNGENLTGWVNVNCAPNTFTVREGIIVSTGIPTGVMRTNRQYENFILELEYKHVKPLGNAGLFVWSDAVTSRGVPFTRSIEVQILDGRNSEDYTSHGDVFAIHGAVLTPDRPHPKGSMRCLPSEHRAKPAGEWNHYRVECNNGVLKLAVNGKVVSGGSACSPRKGYICLESEGSECHFRNIRIHELPSTNPKPEEIAAIDDGFKSLYTGIDLSGWKTESSNNGHWLAKDWILDYDGTSEAANKGLRTEKEYGDMTVIVDVSGYRSGGDLPIQLRGATAAKLPEMSAQTRWNRFVVTLKGDRLTVVLNGQAIVEGAQVAGALPRGVIALQPGSEKMQFANLYVKELGAP